MNTTIKRSIFIDTTIDPAILAATTAEVIRTLFFVRIAQVEISKTGKSELLDDNLKSMMHGAAIALRQLDMNTRNKLDSTDSKWLTTELGKSKLLDIARLVELASKVSSNDSETDYEAFMAMAISALTATMVLQSNKGGLNLPKYKAFYRFLAEEMKAEAYGGQTAVDYNEQTDSLSFRLVQPNAQVPAKASIT